MSKYRRTLVKIWKSRVSDVEDVDDWSDVKVVDYDESASGGREANVCLYKVSV